MKKFLLLIVTAVLFAACGGEEDRNYQFFNGDAIGTSYHIIVANPPADLDAKIQSVFDEANASLSMFNPESQLSKINRNEEVTTNQHIATCYNYATMAYRLSNGKYDITVAPLVDLWGFGPSGKAVEAPTQQQIDSVLQFVGQDGIALNYRRIFKDDPRIQIDLSSVAKGHTVDMMCEMLNELGVEHYLVEIGGELRCKGISSSDRQWRIGIDNPDFRVIPGTSETIATLQLPSEKAVATSGNYRNFYTTPSGQRVVHTIDATTGQPYQSSILSATVVHERCARADALATMLMLSAEPNEENLALWKRRLGEHTEILVVYSDENGKSQVYASEGMKEYMVD